jgi:lysophospholipid acyltransferase (LPLAT)-like uncharacterized protein
MLTRVLNRQTAQSAVAYPLSLYLRFALASTRWSLDGEAHLAPFSAATPVVVAFWHECLPLMPALWRHVWRQNHDRRAHVLVSRHRDGRFIATVLREFHLLPVHGSATRAAGKPAKERGGAASLRALLAALAASDAVVITPDGPRGPPRQAAAGAARLAALAGAPLLPVAGRLRHHFRIRSWDRMIVPLPFGRGVLVCLPSLQIADDGPETIARIGAALTAAADRAEALCTRGAA